MITPGDRPVISTQVQAPSARLRVTRSSQGNRRSWTVLGNRVELSNASGAWTARVWRNAWSGVALQVDGVFADEAKGVAWCEKMVSVLVADLDDEAA